MTPDRRLDQLAPLMADSLQKIDRLIEDQGKLVDLAVNTKAELDEVKATGDATAKAVADLAINTKAELSEVKAIGDATTAVANLAVSTQQQFDRLNTGQGELQENVIDLNANVAGLKANQELILQILREKLP